MALADDDALARLGILPAAPFDWGDAPRMNVGGADASDAPAARAPPSGLDSLVAIVNGEADEGGDAEREIIRSLLKEAGVDASSMAASSSANMGRVTPKEEDLLRDVPIKGLSDRGVAEHTIESKTSLFGSILRLFDAPRAGEEGYIKKGGDATKDSGGGKDGAPKTPAASTPAAKGGTLSPSPSFLKASDPTLLKEPILSTAEIVRSVHLSARPGDVPPGMDSKEYTMAALLFLSGRIPFLREDESEYRTEDDGRSTEGWEQLRRTLPVLPLIKPVNPEASVELRWYGRVRPLVRLGATERKEYPDTMDRNEAFRKKVLNLERMYCSSLPFSSKHTVALPPPTTEQPAVSSKRARHTHDIDAGADDVPFALQRYTPRRKLVPHMEGGVKEELILMISGHMRGSQNAPGGVKGKGSKSKAVAAKGASPVVGLHPIVKPAAMKAGTGIIKTTKTGGAAAK